MSQNSRTTLDLDKRERKIELRKIALRHIEKGYSSEDMRYGDDLYSANEEERDICVDYYYECQDIGVSKFRKKIDQ